MGLVELSRLRGPVLCPEHQKELQTMRWKKRCAGKEAQEGDKSGAGCVKPPGDRVG